MVSLRGSLVLSLVLALPACGDKSSDDAGSATEAPSTDAATSSTGVGTPSTGTSGGTSTTGSTGVASEAASTSVDPTGSTTADTSSEGGEGSTTGSVACTLPDQACAAVEVFGDYEDCGTVDPWNDLTPAWQTARDCALAAAGEGRAFKLITMLQGFDSQVGQAFVGLPGESYAVATFYFDGDPCGGQGCGPVVSRASCDSLAAVKSCAVEPGGACLACVNQSMPIQLCGPR
ncbi:MAG: hypothetical protein H0T76_13480 [Nannocystis sp.]|nr:hypothetical protein [Nannocystis sp.]MBA3547493.1 hypothetical protein [Nannocystis sp.]